MTIYNYPAEAGLDMIGEACQERDYDFDMFVVWRRIDSGALLYGEDSGCSCPSPFENTSVSDLTEFNTYADFDRAFTEWLQTKRRPIEGDGELRAAVAVAAAAHHDYSPVLERWREKHVRVRRENIPI